MLVRVRRILPIKSEALTNKYTCICVDVRIKEKTHFCVPIELLYVPAGQGTHELPEILLCGFKSNDRLDTVFSNNGKD